MSDAEDPDDAGPELTRFEELAVRLGELTNEHPLGKVVQNNFLRRVSYPWIRACLARRTFTDNLAGACALTPERGVLFATNHRSFFDQYAVLLGLWMAQARWAERLYFPVRANFFYEQPLGVLVNYLVGGGVMYPPIFRQSSRAERNKAALERIVAILGERGNMVGIHPEGTRGKGPDPYELLPAQPGIGQVALRARPMVVPVFINGLSNDIVADVRANYQPDIRRVRPVIVVYGEPVDYDDLATQKPRVALYKKTADRFRDAILALTAREKELRAAAQAGAIPDDHPGWLDNLPMGRLYARPA